MSNINLPTNMKNFNYNMNEVGKTIKASKIKHTWELTVDGKHNIIELFQSKLSGKLKIVKNGTTIFYEEEFDTLLSFPFHIDKHNCSLVQSGDTFEFRIDNMVFNHIMELEKNKLLFSSKDPTCTSYKPQVNATAKPSFGIGDVKGQNSLNQKPIFDFKIKDNSNQPQGKFKFDNPNTRKPNLYHSQKEENYIVNQQESNYVEEVAVEPIKNNTNKVEIDDIFSGLSNTQTQNPNNNIIDQYNGIFEQSYKNNNMNEIDFTSKYKENTMNEQLFQNNQVNNKIEEKKNVKSDLDMFISGMGGAVPGYNLGYQNNLYGNMGYPQQPQQYFQQPQQYQQQPQQYYQQPQQYTQQQPQQYTQQQPQQNNLDFFDTVKTGQINTNNNQNINKNVKNSQILDDFF